MVAQRTTPGWPRTKARGSGAGAGSLRPLSLPPSGVRRAPGAGAGSTAGGNARRGCPMASTPRARTTCLRVGRRAPTTPTVTAGRSGWPSPPGRRVAQSTAPCVATMTRGAAPAHCRASQRLRSRTPTPAPGGVPSRGSARACAWGCSRRCTIASGAHGARMGSPPAVWARVPKQPRASARALPAPRAALPLCRGPSPKRPCCAYGPILPDQQTCAGGRTNPARAQPCPSGPPSWRGRSRTWGNAPPRSLGPRC